MFIFSLNNAIKSGLFNCIYIIPTFIFTFCAFWLYLHFKQHKMLLLYGRDNVYLYLSTHLPFLLSLILSCISFPHWDFDPSTWRTPPYIFYYVLFAHYSFSFYLLKINFYLDFWKLFSFHREFYVGNYFFSEF